MLRSVIIPRTTPRECILKFMLMKYVVQIDKHTLHYLSTPALLSRLSETEAAYATRHQQLLHSHYLSSFLSGFPQQLQNLNDTAGGISMIGGPDEDGAVFVRGLGSKEVGGDGSLIVRGRGRDEDSEAEVGRGQVIIARWTDVREHVEKGEIELV